MENLKQYLIEDVNKKIEEADEEIKESNEELEILESKLKVEEKFLSMKDIEKEIKEDVKYSVQAIGNMMVMEKNRNIKLKKDLKILQFRKKVIDKFEDEEL